MLCLVVSILKNGQICSKASKLLASINQYITQHLSLILFLFFILNGVANEMFKKTNTKPPKTKRKSYFGKKKMYVKVGITIVSKF